ncbi:MAG: hydrolase 1, exosortase A system-associated [Sphingomonadales bacterium]
MRRLLTFACEGALLGASLDAAAGSRGMLIVTGGTQTRIGSHRMFDRLAKSLADQGFPCFRFDRRGVGDSAGEDMGFRGNAADIAAAVAAFRQACPQIESVVGFGLCDGATSLALFGARAGVSGLVLVNPWFVESAAGEPAAAAIQHHYRRQLLSADGWKRLLTGSVSYSRLFKGILKIIGGRRAGGLAAETAEALASAGLPVSLILARDDATALSSADVWKSAAFAKRVRHLPQRLRTIETDSHTFARPGDAAALLDACLDALRWMPGSGGG